MNKKIIMIAGFWLCLLAPNLLYPFMKNESDTGTDENRALALQYAVASIPTLLVFRNGQLVNRSVGLISREDVLKLVQA